MERNHVSYQEEGRCPPGKGGAAGSAFSAEQKQLFERAADLQGRSLTEFIVRSAQKAVHDAIKEHEIMSIKSCYYKEFVSVLLKSPAPGKRLKQVAARYKPLMES